MKYNRNNPLRVMTLASGYDSQCLALERLKGDFPEFNYDLVAWAEFDPESKKEIKQQPAVIAHNALFPQYADRNWGDITQIDWDKVPDFDLLFASTPCQDISNAGLQRGFDEGSRTRSSIIWCVHDCVRKKKPKFICMENVSAILSKKFFPTLKLWLDELERMGYKNFMPPKFETPWAGQKFTKEWCLNSKDYGIAQNRLRWFCVSIMRTDDEPEPIYHFPKPFPLTSCLADVLDEDVDEKYFLSDEMLARFCVKSVEQDDPTPTSKMPLGINGCQNTKLDVCANCKFDLSTEQCARLYSLMDKHGKTPLGAKYP